MDLVTIVLVGINVVSFLLPFVINFGGPSSDSFYNFLTLGWKNNSDIRDGEFYRLLTSNFLHGDFWHILFNMYSLVQLGPTIASIFGITSYAIIYMVSGISGSLFSFMFNPAPSVGASGAIFGLVGAMMAFAILSRQYGLLINVFVIILINGVYALDPSHRIDNYGHLGGFLAGLILGFGFLIFGNN